MYFNVSFRNPGYVIHTLFRDMDDINSAQQKVPKRSLDFGLSEKKPKKAVGKKVRFISDIISRCSQKGRLKLADKIEKQKEVS